MDVWTTSDPATIREVYNSITNGENVTYNENTWNHKTDEQFLKKGEDEGYSIGLNYSDKTGHFYMGTGINGGISIKDLGKARLVSDPDSHYGIDGCYNLYTKNETDAAMNFYLSIAGGELGGAALGAIGSRILMNVASDSRVFWSSCGNMKVMGEAAKYAASKGLKTLEMTRLGKILTRATKMTSDKITAPLWRAASRSFANGASGDIHFFTGVNGPNPTSVWRTVEQPILEYKNIITHVVGE